MAPAKEDDDPVIAEYDVFLTPQIHEQLYLVQYPNRPRARPYNEKYGSSPFNVRIKPTSGFLEMDVSLNTEQNFNKYKGLKWGDADRAAKELHNATGTYGPSTGFIWGARSRTRGNIPPPEARETEYHNDLTDFKSAEREGKVHAKQTLGGQIIRHDSQEEVGKPQYFVGAFHNAQLHLTKIAGSVQMRPHFHHLDAEDQRARIAVSRAQTEANGPYEAYARSINKFNKQEQETVETRLHKALKAASNEPWLDVVYTDEEDPLAYEEFERKLKVKDVDSLPHLKSDLDNDAYLDAISAPRHNSPTRRRKRMPRPKEAVDLDDVDVEEVEQPSVAETAG